MVDTAVNEWGGAAVEERLIRAGENEIAVTLYGSGPALVLIHGIGSRGVSWVPVLEELASEFQLVILDLRGHGKSSKPERGYLLTDYAGDLEAVLEALGLERPLVIGHSLGGMTLLEWAIAHPAKAAALVIEDSPMIRGGEGSGDLFDGWIKLSQLPLEEAEAFYAEQNPEWSEAERHRRAVSITSVAPGVFIDMREHMQTLNGAMATPAYAGIASPTLLVYGDLATGGMVPASHAAQFAETVEGAQIVNIPGGTHGLHRDSKQQFLEIVLPFLRKHAEGASHLS